MRPSSTMRVTSVALLLGLALSACGSAQDTSPETKVRSVIREALTSGDPATCSTRFTRAYVEQTDLVKGPTAVRVCEQAMRSRKPADDTTISQVSVSDRQARARVAIHGGDEDGARYDLRLVARDGHWKLDRIVAVELDFERYLRAGRQQIARPPDGVSPHEADCVVGRIRRLGESRLEQMIVSGDAAGLSGSYLPCLQSRTLRRQFETGIRAGLGGRGDAGCVIARLRSSVRERDIRAYVAASLAGGDPPRSLERTIARALLACQGTGGGGTLS